MRILGFVLGRYERAFVCAPSVRRTENTNVGPRPVVAKMVETPLRKHRLCVDLTESRAIVLSLSLSLSRAPIRVRGDARTATPRVYACVGAGSFISPRISIDRLQFTNAETCWIYRRSATLSLHNPLPSVIFSSTRRPRGRLRALRFHARLTFSPSNPSAALVRRS